MLLAVASQPSVELQQPQHSAAPNHEPHIKLMKMCDQWRPDVSRIEAERWKRFAAWMARACPNTPLTSKTWSKYWEMATKMGAFEGLD